MKRRADEEAAIQRRVVDAHLMRRGGPRNAPDRLVDVIQRQTVEDRLSFIDFLLLDLNDQLRLLRSHWPGRQQGQTDEHGHGPLRVVGQVRVVGKVSHEGTSP